MHGGGKIKGDDCEEGERCGREKIGEKGEKKHAMIVRNEIDKWRKGQGLEMTGKEE